MRNFIYKGIRISESLIKNLSLEMQQWLEYYQSLSEELRMMVNYEPDELIKVCNLSKNTPTTVHDADNYTFNGHPVFNQLFWNSADNILKANCYAHAMNVTVTVNKAKLQPGEIQNIEIPLAGQDLFAAANVIKTNSIADATSGLLDKKNDLKVCMFTDIPHDNEYMVALCVAPVIGSSLFFDYHWYKQDITGKWSHKPGLTSAVQVDASEKSIDAKNPPHKCDRTYTCDGDTLDYNYFVSYFMVTHS